MEMGGQLCASATLPLGTERPAHFFCVEEKVFLPTGTNPCFLGAFAEQRQTTLNFVMSVCLSVRVEQLPPTGRIVMTFDI